MTPFARVLRAFDADGFAAKHGGYRESRHSREYLLPCPKCSSSRLRWNATKGGWICWSCKETGGTIDLVALFERCDYERALELVENAYVGGDAPTQLVAAVPSATQPKVLRARRLPSRTLPPAVPLWEHAQAWAYAQSRGIDLSTARKYALLAGVSGPTNGYVIFPCRMDGTTVYWQGRASWNPPFGGEAGKKWAKETGYRKTLNPPSREDRAAGGEVLFGFDFARTAEHVVIVEGPVDAIKVGTHAVALLGQGTDAKLARLRAMKARRYTVYLDRGESEAARAQWLARELSAIAETYIATPPEGWDAGALSPSENEAVVSAATRYQPGLVSAIR